MERREIAVRGIVQGVGFRPFVYSLASRLALQGFVCNTRQSVVIQVEGEPAALDSFCAELLSHAPPAASIDAIESTVLQVRGERGFRIDSSRTGALEGNVRIPPDAATCPACLEELFDPGSRRYLYPFITCATCGPRLTIVTGAPYDRERTTMAPFVMCGACRREYEDPRDRRFHAETIACAACGPSLSLRDAAGRVIPGDPLGRLAALLREGRIAAIKGPGGYHLACDATRADVVEELRRRKHRDEKPFAVMFASLQAIRRVCEVGEAERQHLVSPVRPIVLLRRLEGAFAGDAPVREIAPGAPSLGAMLPSTPLQHLLLRAAGRPLVMTSGNRSHEPVAFGDDEARERLAGIADVFLANDRAIHVRCDDGVTRVVGGLGLPIRRSRGDAPRPIALRRPCPQPVLAVGGHLKNTFALGQQADAFVSHHVGDLDDHAALEAFRREIDLYESLLAIAPRLVVHDLHPDYHSTRYAVERALGQGLRTLAVQHHHAHVASCLAEHRIDGRVIGVAFDGSGLGTDGTIWGGEFLVGDAGAVVRMAHLRPVRLPGGEQAVREPWRMAMSCLLDAGEDAGLVARRHPAAAPVLACMIERGINAPLTSSAGRLFDAVAALAGVRDRVTFEGQAAVQLEWLSGTAGAAPPYPVGIEVSGGPMVLDTRPLIRAVARDVRAGAGPALIGARFHAGLADGIARLCGRIRGLTGLDRVVLTGGVFLNARLTEACMDRLGRRGFAVYRHRLVPPNDGGLSLGQVAVAAARLAQEAGDAPQEGPPCA